MFFQMYHAQMLSLLGRNLNLKTSLAVQGNQVARISRLDSEHRCMNLCVALQHMFRSVQRFRPLLASMSSSATTSSSSSSSSTPAAHPNVAPVAALLGTWQGKGRGVFPTIQPFEYEEEIVFSSERKPFVAYTQRTSVRMDAAGRCEH
jgi:hypothetical protein